MCILKRQENISTPSQNSEIPHKRLFCSSSTSNIVGVLGLFEKLSLVACTKDILAKQRYVLKSHFKEFFDINLNGYTCMTPPPGPSDSLRNSSGRPIALPNQSMTLTSNSTHAGLDSCREKHKNIYYFEIKYKV